jgi:hypothetical protein
MGRLHKKKQLLLLLILEVITSIWLHKKFEAITFFKVKAKSNYSLLFFEVITSVLAVWLHKKSFYF